MYLVDSNIWLEVLLEQERSREAQTFLRQANVGQLAITDFTLHSIGVILIRQNRHDLLKTFLTDLEHAATVNVVALELWALSDVAEASRTMHLDFDDAYQYISALTHRLTLVSFDADFDRTPQGRKLPSDVIGSPPRPAGQE